MRYENITTDRQLSDYCRELSRAESIAFDTEFVSENTYRPILCLVQVAAGDRLAIIDAMAIDDMGPFWQVVAEPGHRTIVHAGRSEMEFCLKSVGRRPAGLVDVQLAAALTGGDYPASYSTLLGRVLGETPKKHETRTDWRRRPLSKRQIEYALEDVIHLHPIYETLRAKLEKLGRLAWLDEEMAVWQEEVERSISSQRWRRVSGSAGLDARRLAMVREMWQWRETEAERRNQPVRRVLRDDLIVELAKRASSDPERIAAVRGLDRGDLRRRLPQLADCIRRANEMPESEWPQTVPRDYPPKLSVLGQFLFAALGSVCRRAGLAPNLVGTPNDIRDLIVYRAEKKGDRANKGRPINNVPVSSAEGEDRSEARSGKSASNITPDPKPPRLAQGWRAEVVGRLFEDLLAGKTAIRIEDPSSETPLAFDAIE